MPSSAWTDSEDRKLLLAVITVLSPAPPKWDLVAAKMTDKTAEAVRQRYQKLKKLGDDGAASVKEGSPAASKSVPTKRTPAKEKTAAKRKASEDEDDAADGGADKPTTKKRTPKKAAKDVKVEEEDEADAAEAVVSTPTTKKRTPKKATKDIKVEEEDEATVESGAGEGGESA